MTKVFLRLYYTTGSASRSGDFAEEKELMVTAEPEDMVSKQM
jgi:hypothetical protein